MTDPRKPGRTCRIAERGRAGRPWAIALHTARSAIAGPALLGRRGWARCWALVTVTVTCMLAARAVTASLLGWLAYWPGLAFALSRAAGWVRTTARAMVRVARPLGRAAARTARTAVGFIRRWIPVLTRHVWQTTRRATVRCGCAVRWVARRLWRSAEPSVRDAAGWLVHTAPRQFAHWLARLLVRLARWAPGGLVRLLGWSVVGAGWLVARVTVYCATYPEYAGMIREARELDKPRRVHALQLKWRHAALRRTGFFVVLGLAVWLGCSIAVDRYGTRAQLVITTAVVLALAIVGRIVKPPKEGEPSTPDDVVADENAPYPIADAHTRAEAADCVTRALAAENICLRMTGEARRTPWGWEVPVILRSGTPAGIVAKTGELETHLDLPAGGVLATPDRSRRARVVLRLAQEDPFRSLGDAPARAPRSATITQRAEVGRRIDGAPLIVPLLGVHGVVIGSPGAGKSTTLLALADAVTACADAIAWDLDPAGYGLDALDSAIGRRGRDPAGIEDALADAVTLATARPKLLRALGMGAAWQPDAARPALVVFVDEYPRLTSRAKELAVHLLRIGRKSRVSLILAATEATSDALGAAIADTTALRVLHACRNTDVRLVLGPQMAAEGWRPDRLRPATADDPGDVGKCYVATAGLWEPLVSKVAPVWEDDAAERGRQRAAAGVPRIDMQSWERARALRAADRTPGGTGAGGRADVDRQAVTDMIAVFGDDARLWTEEILSRLVALDTRYIDWAGEDLAALLRPLDLAPRNVRIGTLARKGYYRDEITAAFQAWQDGGDRW